VALNTTDLVGVWSKRFCNYQSTYQLVEIELKPTESGVVHQSVVVLVLVELHELRTRSLLAQRLSALK
jgi:hypothetical protein